MGVANGLNGSIILVAINPEGNQTGVYRVSTNGALTPYNVPAAQSNVFSDYLGVFNGSMWFVGGPVYSSPPYDIGVINASGTVQVYSQSSFIAGRRRVELSAAVGRDGYLYMLDNTGAIYRLAPNKLPTTRGARAPRHQK